MWNICVVSLCSLFVGANAYLFPEESESRQVKSLNGIWRYVESSDNLGFVNKWYEKDFTHIVDNGFLPVPSSFNDVLITQRLTDFLGWIWYQKEFYLGKKWSGFRIFVYFGAVDHHSVIWCNGKEVGKHSGGHVPFHVEITRAINWSGKNTLTLAVNNTLTPYTLPQGYTRYPNNSKLYPPGTSTYSHNCDYFDYAGINRNVYLYSVPQTFIKDFNVYTETDQNYTGCSITYKIEIENKDAFVNANCSVKLIDNDSGSIAMQSEGCEKTIQLEYCNYWYTETAKMHKLVLKMHYYKHVDVYRTYYGIRQIEWKSGMLKMNGMNFYLKGFGMHEDSDIRGRGYDDVMTLRDISILQWSVANVIRTSHYPYSQEFLKQCDYEGIAVILEIPACSLEGFSNELYIEHERIMLEIISIYKQHTSIIMWSLANEPNTSDNASVAYFEKLYKAARAADPTRPITFVTSQPVDQEKALGAMDVVLVNRYSGWYQTGGRLDLVGYQIIEEITAWRNKFNKPVVLSEYGAGSISGQHSFQPSMWSEDYQVALLKKHFEAFDQLKNKSILSGEMIWNLIDFKTPQEHFRPGFCMKGAFTRQREPKEAAKIIRNRYIQLDF